MVGTTVAPWQLFFQQSYISDKRSPRGSSGTDRIRAADFRIGGPRAYMQMVQFCASAASAGRKYSQGPLLCGIGGPFFRPAPRYLGEKPLTGRVRAGVSASPGSKSRTRSGLRRGGKRAWGPLSRSRGRSRWSARARWMPVCRRWRTSRTSKHVDDWALPRCRRPGRDGSRGRRAGRGGGGPVAPGGAGARHRPGRRPCPGVGQAGPADPRRTRAGAAARLSQRAGPGHCSGAAAAGPAGRLARRALRWVGLSPRQPGW